MRDVYLGLNQRNAMELKNKHLDGKGESLVKTEDLILLRRIGDFILSSVTLNVVVENECYHWINYTTIQEDLPMIFTSIVSLKKRVEKLKNMGVLINKKVNIKKEKTSEDGFKKAGTYSVIKLSKDARKLFDIPVAESEEEEGLHHKGVKGKHHEGVNKEYQETNTKKKITTTTNLDNLNNIEQPVKQPEKVSSSSSSEIKTIKKYLQESIKDIPTCKNIMELVNSKNLKLERLQEVIEYANKNQKGLGYIVNALKNDWDVTPVQAKKINSVPKCGESKKIADTNSYMEKEQIEKEKIKSETVEIIEITEELEKEAVALLLENGVPREYLETTKRKLKDYYYKILRKALKDYKRVS